MVGKNLDSETAREMGRKGAQKTNAIKKKKKSIRETAQIILNLSMGDDPESVKDLDEVQSIKEITKAENLTVLTAILMQINNKAVRGDLKAAEMLFKYTGEVPDQIEVSTPNGQPLTQIVITEIPADKMKKRVADIQAQADKYGIAIDNVDDLTEGRIE